MKQTLQKIDTLIEQKNDEIQMLKEELKKLSHKKRLLLWKWR